ncbi:hypothetical protein VTN77DRAFT_7376 [Rasamsonia byssochlamydoides]|uniref:uncharacterized protein n=1 Tax=Rasamsonia byssochlamydoides TaxID=89139 RepID=UPI003742A26C
MINLLVSPQRGLTQKLAKATGGPCLTLFSRPHGISAPIDQCRTIVMVASDFGMVSFLPYLRQLIYSYNTWKSPTRQIHVVWQLQKPKDGKAIRQERLNAILDDNKLGLWLDRNSGN